MGFPIVVIDPMSFLSEFIEKSPGRRLGRHLASVSGGDLVAIPAMKIPDHARRIADIMQPWKRETGSGQSLDKASAGLFEIMQRLSGMA